VFQNFAYLGTYFYWFNVKKAPMDNKNVRKALSLAIDRERLVTFVTKGNQMPGTMYVPPGTAGYNPIPTPAKGSQSLGGSKAITQASRLRRRPKETS
jgi:ABC-type oligopeptide transport system substrate-binding subunit